MTPYPVADLQTYLLGGWRLTRLVWDARQHRFARLSGTAAFTTGIEALAFEERGTLRLGQTRGEATQRYRFEIAGEGGMIVRFEDGRLFHRLDLRSGVARVRHDCTPDLYLGRYRVDSVDRWRVAWRVQGPRKDMLIVSHFTRGA